MPWLATQVGKDCARAARVSQKDVSLHEVAPVNGSVSGIGAPAMC